MTALTKTMPELRTAFDGHLVVDFELTATQVFALVLDRSTRTFELWVVTA